eukprot:gnl/Chilomastix_caulleri/6051.p2 GENE.gnl/Chilomastix_caulleri/6051~~gnl/Chilomastix_caulleri/6051.p2  ORF type:complete len:67 (+),score=17.20 gnl/Chilomastix_caulleri/6051:159-359(+)
MKITVSQSNMKNSKNIMGQLGIERSEEEIKEAFTVADCDGSGSIDFFEFVNFIKSEDISENLSKLN